MRPKTIHVLLDMAPIVKSRGKPIPRFICLPGWANTITYVEPKSERPVCRFCYQMGHTAYHCTHRKGCYFSEIDQDKENGVTKVRGKTFLRLKPKWWLPMEVTEIPNMRAIQQSMATRHKVDWDCVESLSNREVIEDHDNPSTPAPVYMDEEPPLNARTIHPDTEVWHKANNIKKSPPGKKTPTKGDKDGPPQPSEKPPQAFKVNMPAPSQQRKQGNPILMPGDQGMTTDFSANQFAAFKKFVPPPNIPKSDTGIKKAHGTLKTTPKTILILVGRAVVYNDYWNN
ncbi:hypothetical protein DSO57_1002350 [Entomophthora muscae]|uniref:Uncharacterized protein n=1 Tax=Entomophthora muscae TaxID=34485 RepID=A0ACC2UU82_9FUNG|nr:hypothetical protein DSO57_1002350 [Entomophthora muscae]